jgi:MFS family permease
MIGLFASIFPIGGILGPNLGGFIIEQFGWRQTFMINVPLGILVVGLLLRQALAPLPARQAARRSIDVVGTALFAASIVAFLVALTLLGNDPTFLRSPIFWLLLVGSVVTAAATTRPSTRRLTSWSRCSIPSRSAATSSGPTCRSSLTNSSPSTRTIASDSPILSTGTLPGHRALPRPARSEGATSLTRCQPPPRPLSQSWGGPG